MSEITLAQIKKQLSDMSPEERVSLRDAIDESFTGQDLRHLKRNGIVPTGLITHPE